MRLGALTTLPALAASAANADAPAKQPNVIIITTDQQSWNMLGIDGNKLLSTPAMDRLAREGYRFRKVYDTNPVSMPSRFSLYTGHYSSELGTKDNTPHPEDTQKNIAIATEFGMGNLFRKAGYETVYSGKVHLYAPANKKPLDLYGFRLEGYDAYDGPVEFAQKFFAERKATDKPFLAVFSFLNPHDICEQAGIGRKPTTLKNAESIRLLGVQKDLPASKYTAQIPPMVANTAPINGEQPAWVEMDSNSREWTKTDWSLYRWLYYRLTESVDSQVGRILDAFFASPFADNTIIVFTSDHGDMQGAHGLTLKNVPFEECQRIPFIFWGPGIQKGVADDKTLVCNGLDLIPTICDLTGVSYSKSLTGISLKNLVTGQGAAPARDYIFTETYNSFTINDGRYKYTVFELPGNPEMLVDLKNDPGELKNLVGDKASQELKTAMKDKLMKNLASRNLLPLPTDRTLKFIRARQHDSKETENVGQPAGKGGKQKNRANEDE